MPDHTPGPWCVAGPSDNMAEAEVIEATNRTIAWTANTYDEEDGEIVTQEDRANARLVAAAPKLKAIVEGFLGTLTTEDAAAEAVVHRYYDTNIALFNLAIDTIQELRGEISDGI
jgi:phosphoglycerate dehydrogenase-like enzyme